MVIVQSDKVGWECGSEEKKGGYGRRYHGRYVEELEPINTLFLSPTSSEYTSITKFKPSIRANHTPSTPPPFLGTKHPNHARDFRHIPGSPPRLLCALDIHLVINPLPFPHQRRIQHERLHLRLKRFARALVHVRGHRTGIDGVDGGTLAEFAGPGARHGFDGGFGAAVEGLFHETHAGRHGREVDDSPGAVVGEVRESGLHEQDGAEHVDGVEFREHVRGDVGQRVVCGDGGVVDDDVDLEFGGFRVGEVVFRRGDDVGGTLRGAHVGLDGEGADVVGRLEVRAEVLGGLGGGVGGVV